MSLQSPPPPNHSKAPVKQHLDLNLEGDNQCQFQIKQEPQHPNLDQQEQQQKHPDHDKQEQQHPNQHQQDRNQKDQQLHQYKQKQNDDTYGDHREQEPQQLKEQQQEQKLTSQHQEQLASQHQYQQQLASQHQHMPCRRQDHLTQQSQDQHHENPRRDHHTQDHPHHDHHASPQQPHQHIPPPQPHQHQQQQQQAKGGLMYFYAPVVTASIPAVHSQMQFISSPVQLGSICATTSHTNLQPFQNQQLVQPASPIAEQVYPPPLASHGEVVLSKDLFLNTLTKLHAAMGTKLAIPRIGGKDLDLHLLYKEVTTRGGHKMVTKDRKWKEITLVFNFPSTTTSASFVLRRYYNHLLHHYEQVYFFQVKGRLVQPPEPEHTHSPLEDQESDVKKQKIDTTQARVDPTSSIGSIVNGRIVGKFDNGYLITVKAGTRELNGVLYHVDPSSTVPQGATVSVFGSEVKGIASEHHTEHRQKKRKMSRKDPNAPRQNKTGYNFFFAEQRNKLKSTHTDKDKAISKIIGEMWNRLSEEEKQPYQQRGLIDKERYKIEKSEFLRKTLEAQHAGVGTSISPVGLQQRGTTGTKNTPGGLQLIWTTGSSNCPGGLQQIGRTETNVSQGGLQQTMTIGTSDSSSGLQHIVTTGTNNSPGGLQQTGTTGSNNLTTHDHMNSIDGNKFKAGEVKQETISYKEQVIWPGLQQTGTTGSNNLTTHDRMNSIDGNKFKVGEVKQETVPYKEQVIRPSSESSGVEGGSSSQPVALGNSGTNAAKDISTSEEHSAPIEKRGS